jgi:hypothetical protein
MVRQKILRLGMRVKCDQCSQTNWFALDELRDVAACQWCLDEVRFPTAKPPKQPQWAYRPLGPFGAKGHAHGAYVVAAAIRALRGSMGEHRTTWVPSFLLKTKDSGQELEADFGLLWEAQSLTRTPTQLVLGECKTFNSFALGDIKRMKVLAKAFPRAVVVFATLKLELALEEKKLIAPFARWGRENWQTPVMVLTARELTSRFGFPFSWMHAGNDREQQMYKRLIAAPSPRRSLRRLADATQQLHLGLAEDRAWPHPEAP